MKFNDELLMGNYNRSNNSKPSTVYSYPEIQLMTDKQGLDKAYGLAETYT